MGTARSGIGWLLANILRLVVAWGATAYFTRALSSPQAVLGQFAFFETIVSFGLLLSAAGTTSAVNKRVSSTEVSAIRNRAVGAGLAIVAGRLGIVLLILISSLPLFINLFSGGITIGILTAALVSILAVQGFLNSTLKGLSNVGRVGVVGFIDSLGRATSQIIFVSFGLGLLGLAGGAVIGTGLATIFALYLLMGKVGLSKPTRDEISWTYSYTKSNAISGIATKFYDNIDIVLIKSMIGDSATGVYSVGFRFGLPIKIISGAVSSAMFPSVSKQDGQNNNKQVSTLISDGLLYATIIALPATVGMAVIAKPLIVTFYTEAFADSAIIAAVAVSIQIPDGFRSVLSTALDAIDRPDIPARGGIILVMVNAVLDFILIPIIGPAGAIVASFIGITIATCYLAYHAYGALKLTLTDLPVREFGAEICSALLMGGSVLWLREWLAVGNILLIMITVPVGITVYFGMLLILSSGIRDRLLGILADLQPGSL
jgi:O-antigen/teichoic acid export membrane protein